MIDVTSMGQLNSRIFGYSIQTDKRAFAQWISTMSFDFEFRFKLSFRCEKAMKLIFFPILIGTDGRNIHNKPQ